MMFATTIALRRGEDSIDQHCFTSTTVAHDGCIVALRREMPHEMRYEPSDHYLLVLHRSGPVAIEVDVGSTMVRRVVPAGNIHVVPPGCRFDFKLLEPLSTLHLTLPAAWLPPEPAGTMRKQPTARVWEDPVLHHLLEALAQYVELGSGASNSFESYCLRAIGDHLARLPDAAAQQIDDTGDARHRDRERVHAAIDYMERNLATPFSVHDVAVAVGISASRFARNFKQVTGRSPQRYVGELRLMRSRALLATNLSIIGVALSCGFSNQEHFTNRFRAKFGEPPGRWRQRQRGQGASEAS